MTPSTTRINISRIGAIADEIAFNKGKFFEILILIVISIKGHTTRITRLIIWKRIAGIPKPAIPNSKRSTNIIIEEGRKETPKRVAISENLLPPPSPSAKTCAKADPNSHNDKPIGIIRDALNNGSNDSPMFGVISNQRDNVKLGCKDKINSLNVHTTETRMIEKKE
jgi:hypothetical protein